jgi:8-oxo-dGTP pyrophosphatase MutT (NUDIX family)
MADRYLSTDAAAAEIGVDPETLRRWVRARKITPTMRTAGGHLRWHLEDIRTQLRNPPAAGEPMTEPAAPGPRPIVAAIVISDLGILLTQRNDGVPPWGFCTGKIEPGELPHAAAEREVMEETGLAVRAAVTIAERIHPKTKTPMSYVACNPTGATAITVADADELAAVEWVSLTRALELMQPPFTMYEPVQAYLARREHRQPVDVPAAGDAAGAAYDGFRAARGRKR